MVFNHKIDPILLDLGRFQIRYYGLFIVIGILLCMLTWRLLLKSDKVKFEIFYDLLVWLIIGGTIGARLGHVFFYEWDYYAKNLFEIIMIQKGGLSSHGMTLGLIAAFLIFGKVKKIKIKDFIDLVIVPIPILIFFIRMANFINSEIIGRPTNSNYGVRFYLAEENPIPRHPSQIYEALIGLAIFAVNILVYKYFVGKKKIPYLTFNIFIFVYFTSRFFVEYFKEYQVLDPTSPFTMGQYLSIPFIIFSISFFVYIFYKKKKIKDQD